MSVEFALVDHTDKTYIWLGSKSYSNFEEKGWLFQMNPKRMVDFIGGEDKLGHQFEYIIGDNIDCYPWFNDSYKEVDRYQYRDDKDEGYVYKELRWLNTKSS